MSEVVLTKPCLKWVKKKMRGRKLNAIKMGDFWNERNERTRDTMGGVRPERVSFPNPTSRVDDRQKKGEVSC